MFKPVSWSPNWVPLVLAVVLFACASDDQPVESDTPLSESIAESRTPTRSAESVPTPASVPSTELQLPAVARLQDNAATNDPCRAAWELFIQLNRPSPLDSKHTNWETWASAEYVFGDPNRSELDWPTQAPAQKQVEGIPVQQKLFQDAVKENAVSTGQPVPEFGDQVADSIKTEVRMNVQAFDWIVLQRLWYLNEDGQQLAYNNMKKGLVENFEFPMGSVFVKAGWKEVSPADTARYHTQMIDGALHGLIAFHIAAKILPTWFWATWEFVDNPQRTMVTRQHDDYGLDPFGKVASRLLDDFDKASMDSSLWSNYRLNGTQQSFTSPRGAPTLLANSVLERGFLATSSCMTCHSRSSVGHKGKRLTAFEPSLHVGAPKEHWFSHPDSGLKYLQLDFVWSLARAQVRTVTDD